MYTIFLHKVRKNNKMFFFVCFFLMILLWPEPSIARFKLRNRGQVFDIHSSLQSSLRPGERRGFVKWICSTYLIYGPNFIQRLFLRFTWNTWEIKMWHVLCHHIELFCPKPLILGENIVFYYNTMGQYAESNNEP